ncbi:hypothetical protein, partial [Escherichia coli]
TSKTPSYTKSVSWQHHPVLKAGISADTQSDFGAGVGVGYSF